MNHIYIHIPFCSSKCQYCSFVSYPGLESLYERYGNALCREIELHADSSRIDTLFFGGGTPTVLKKEQLAMILDCCRDQFVFNRNAEISLEANPDTVSANDLSYIKDSGFNRISFGVQSFNDHELNTLGRIHDAQRAQQAVSDARAAGFENLSLDLMYGLPGQTPATWRETLERAMQLAPDHLSAYQLSIEDGTGFAELEQRGELRIPEEDLVLAMDEITRELTETAGLKQYEISNYSRPGYMCNHNIGYWNNEEYFGFGAGAVSYRDGVRSVSIKNPEQFCTMIEKDGEPIETSEQLTRIDSFKETVVMGLRLHSGVADSRLQQRYGLGLLDVYGELLDSLQAQGLIVFEDGCLQLSDRGRSFANLVMAELV